MLKNSCEFIDGGGAKWSAILDGVDDWLQDCRLHTSMTARFKS